MTIGGGGDIMSNIVQPLPSDEEFKNDMLQAGGFKEDDPSKYYEIVKKIGFGGFARVFLVKRKED